MTMANGKHPAADRDVGAADNRPPLITTAELTRDHAPRNGTILDLEKRAATVPQRIDDDETSGTWQELIKEIDGCQKDTNAVRVSVKEPFLAGGRVVDGFFQTLAARLDKARGPVARVVQDYLQRKAAEERRRREEEAQQLREAEELARQRALKLAREAEQAEQRRRMATAETKQAAADDASDEAQRLANQATVAERDAGAKSADLARTRSVGGALGTLADTWDFAVDDIDAVKGSKLWPYVTAGAKLSAIRAYMKANAPRDLQQSESWQPIEGIRFFRTSKLQVR
jgi:hypothetical protein